MEDAAALARALNRGRLEVVITELTLGWSDGMAILGAVRDGHPGVPVVMFTSDGDVELATAGMKAGLADFVVKSSRGFLRLVDAAAAALDRAATRQAVARSEPWLQTLLDRAGVGVFRSTPDQRLIEANPALLRLLGVSSVREALELDLPIHHFRRESQDEPVRSGAGDVQSRVVEIERPDGTTVRLAMTEVLLLDVDGDIVVDGIAHDVSHLEGADRRTSERLAELERLTGDLAEFASAASHELKEPLRMVAKHAELLREDAAGRLPAEALQSIDYITGGAQRMEALLAALLSFSRISGGRQSYRPCDCDALVDGVIRQLEDEILDSGAEIERERLPTVVADPAQLGQVFRNLLHNALKFRGDEPPRIRISVLEGEDEWVFSVRDNGIGIPKADAADVFTVFRRLHPESYAGTGIGLALCRRIVERHGGRIWVESTPGRGSTFSFTIPFQRDRAARGARAMTHGPSREEPGEP